MEILRQQKLSGLAKETTGSLTAVVTSSSGPLCNKFSLEMSTGGQLNRPTQTNENEMMTSAQKTKRKHHQVVIVCYSSDAAVYWPYICAAALHLVQLPQAKDDTDVDEDVSLKRVCYEIDWKEALAVEDDPPVTLPEVVHRPTPSDADNSAELKVSAHLPCWNTPVML